MGFVEGMKPGLLQHVRFFLLGGMYVDETAVDDIHEQLLLHGRLRRCTPSYLYAIAAYCYHVKTRSDFGTVVSVHVVLSENIVNEMLKCVIRCRGSDVLSLHRWVVTVTSVVVSCVFDLRPRHPISALCSARVLRVVWIQCDHPRRRGRVPNVAPCVSDTSIALTVICQICMDGSTSMVAPYLDTDAYIDALVRIRTVLEKVRRTEGNGGDCDALDYRKLNEAITQCFETEVGGGAYTDLDPVAVDVVGSVASVGLRLARLKELVMTAS